MAMERVMRGADASLVVMHILTSKKMPKRVYIDDVIDRVALFLRFQVCKVSWRPPRLINGLKTPCLTPSSAFSSPTPSTHLTTPSTRRSPRARRDTSAP